MNISDRSLLVVKYIILLCLVVVILIGCTTLNPATGRNEFIFIPTADEVRMGQDIHQQLAEEHILPSTDARAAKVQVIGRKLASVSDRKDYIYHFYVIDKDELNAFTTPGGNVYIHSGLLSRLKRDDQVASVLAHEVGHCAARHTIKKFQAALGYSLIGSIVLSQVAGEQAQQIAGLSSDALMGIIFSAYGRKDEYEADRLGVKYMYLSGYDLAAAVEVLEVLQKEASGPDIPLMLRSHPHLADRIIEVKKEIKLAEQKYGKK